MFSEEGDDVVVFNIFFSGDSFERVKETDITNNERTQTGKEKEMEWKIKT